jgi:metal-dependent amidase/aminoacylase/carboxypeptidase family protein
MEIDDKIFDLVDKTIQESSNELRKICLEIHEKSELGYEETKAHKLLTDYLDTKGFQVTLSFVFPTAFLASFTLASTPEEEKDCITIGFLAGISCSR